MWLWNLMKPDEIITDILVVIGIAGIDPDVWRLFRSLVACTYPLAIKLGLLENPTCIVDFPFKPGNRCPAMHLNARCFLHFENKGPIGTARACQSYCFGALTTTYNLSNLGCFHEKRINCMILFRRHFGFSGTWHKGVWHLHRHVPHFMQTPKKLTGSVAYRSK